MSEATAALIEINIFDANNNLQNVEKNRTTNRILAMLREEKELRLKGGLYHQTQIKLAFNSNRIEGGKLSEEQTRYIFETNTIGVEAGETANVDDIIETVNHFACFDYMLENAGSELSEDMIKEFHRLLKRGTSQERINWFRVGDYKAKPNMVGDTVTARPGKVAQEMRQLILEYSDKVPASFNDIIDFHHRFETIHPFQDGNGRVGRIIMFKECLKNKIMPFIIDHRHKQFYYRGLREFRAEKGFLTETCRSAQDSYEKLIAYFFQELDKHGL
ncbi:MAG: Fic family protein [Gracilibacteraceae bacterium]|jgi:Fic family protein|nr:Fic family protein [Gracilibacteraceae bacterium]